MKVNYLLKSVLMTVFVLAAASVSAVDVTDFAGLKAAVDGAKSGDVITIKGNIKSTEALTLKADGVTIEGDDVEIESAGTDRILNIAAPYDGAYIWIKGISFINGSADGNGGAINVSDGKVHFTNCIFLGNYSSDGGGAVYGEGKLDNEAGPTRVLVEFYGCEFYENISQKAGGAVRGANDTRYEFYHCKIQDNKAIDSRGGALCFNNTKDGVRIYHSIISNNKTEAKVADSQGTGGIQCTGQFLLQIESSSLTGNKGAGDHASLINLDGKGMVLTVINSTIAKNINGSLIAEGQPGEDGLGSGGGTGSIWCPAGGEQILTFVNTTYMENRTAPNNNGGNSSGISVQDPGVTLRVYNSVFLGNLAYSGGVTPSPNGSVDILVRAEMKEFTIKNSIIGNIHNGSAVYGDADFSLGIPWTVDAKSKIDEYTYNTNGDWQIEDESGVFMEYGAQTNYSWGDSYYTFFRDAYTNTLGDPALLLDQDTDVDQFLISRPAGATISAGSVEGIYEDDDYPEVIIPEDPFLLLPTAIREVAPIQDQVKISTLAERNGYINVDFGKYHGKARADLISINGQVVKTFFNNQIEGRYPCDVMGIQSGIYLVRVTLDNNSVVSQRVVIK